MTAMSTPTSRRPSFDVQYHQYRHGPKPSKRPRGRWIWAISGLIMIALMCASVSAALSRPNAIHPMPTGEKTRTVAVSESITQLSVRSYGGDVQVIGGGSRTRVTERVYYDPQVEPTPAVVNSVSDGRLTLTIPSCATQGCVGQFTVTIPATASVTAVTDGGDVSVSGVAGATLDSGGGRVRATSVSGPLTVASEGGDQNLRGIAGSLRDESGGGAVTATGVTGPSAVIVTDGGQLIAQRLSVQTAILSSGSDSAQVQFASAPTSVDIATDGGNATVLIPGGPYALTADSGGASQVVGIPVSPAARSTLNVTTGGSALVIEPAAGAAATVGASASGSAWTDQHATPAPPPVPSVPSVPNAP